MESNMMKFDNQKTDNQKTDHQNQVSTDLMRHKAMKYHYKIQNLLNEKYITKGLNVPTGYEQYLQSFQG